MTENAKSKYTPIERNVLSVGIMALRRNIYATSDKNLIKLLIESREELVRSNDDLWESLIQDIEIELGKRKIEVKK